MRSLQHEPGNMEGWAHWLPLKGKGTSAHHNREPRRRLRGTSSHGREPSGNECGLGEQRRVREELSAWDWNQAGSYSDCHAWGVDMEGSLAEGLLSTF